MVFSGADGTYNFNGTTTLTSGAGVTIASGSDGTFSFGSNASINSPLLDPEFKVSDNMATVTYSGSITESGSFRMILIQNHSTGTVTFNTGTLSATAGNGIQLDNADGTYNFNGTTTLNGGDAGIDIINGSAGTFNFASGTTITSPSGIAFNVDGGTASVTYNGNITQASNAAMVSVSGGHTTGTITFQTGTLNASNGTGLQFNNADSTTSYNFNGTTTLNGGDAGIDIFNGCAGTFTFGSGVAITNPSGIAYREDTSTATVNYNGTITKTTGNQTAVDINAKTGGATTFSGAVAGSNNNQNVIDLTNTGGTVTFRGGLSITTSSGIGFNATGAGATVNVCDENPCAPASTGGLVNTITSTTGTALNVVNTTIGTNNLEFRSISSNGAPNGINLNNTGSTGGLKVKGTATGSDRCGGTITVNAVGTAATVNAAVPGECTGGTIQASTAAGIQLTNTANVSLSRMRVFNGLADQINVATINGFTLSNSLITDSAGVAGDKGIEMGDFSTGTAVNGTISIANSTIGPTPHDNFGVGIGSGTSTWSITGVLFDDSQLNSGFNHEIRNATMTSFVMDGCVLRNQFADGMQMQPAAGVNATMTSATIQNTSFLGNNIGMDLNHDGTGISTYKVFSNTFLNQVANSINFFSSAVQAPATGGTLNGRFEDNVIGNAAVSGSGGGIGIRININGGAHSNVLVDSNTIRQIPNGRGIEIISRNGTAGTDATVTNNFVNTDFVPNGVNLGFSLSNIFLQSNCVTVCNTLRADIRGNTVPVTPPTGELIAGQIAVLETSPGATLPAMSVFELVNNAPAGTANCTAELTEAHTNPAHNNTGSAAASASCALIAGPLTTPPVSANPADETGSNIIHGFDNKPNFLNASYQSAFEWDSSKFRVPSSESETIPANATAIASMQVEVTMTEEPAAETQIATAMISGVADVTEESAATADETASSSNLISALTEIRSKIGQAIMPTASAQNVVTMRDDEKPLAPLAGETICVNGDGDTVSPCGAPGFTLPANSSVTITFRATANALPGPSQTAPSYTTVSNQGTVTGSNFSAVLTDDPSVGGATDPTVTPIDHTTVGITSNANPSIEGQNVTFTATMTGVPSRLSDPPGTVQFRDNGVNMGAAVPIVVGAVNDNVSTAQFSTTALTLGDHTITAYYSGGGAGATSYNANVGSMTGNPQVVNASADLQVTKTDSPEPVLAGNNITYTITVTNPTGPSVAQAVTLSDVIPTGTTFQSVTTPAGWTRTDSTAVNSTGTLTFTKDAQFGVGETGSVFTVVVKVGQSAVNGSTITNNAVVASTTNDPTTPNNTGTATTLVSNVADLSITNSDSPDPVNAGGNITYTINVTNNGTNAAEDVSALDQLLAPATFVSAAVISGTGWSISAPVVGTTGTVTFTHTGLFTGTAQFQVVANVPPATPAATVITNNASVQSTTTVDQNPGNEVAQATTTVVTCATPPANMRAWYPGDGNLRDIAGGYDATGVPAASYTTLALGKVGQAFDLNGTTQYIERVDTTGMDTNASAFSFDAWVFWEGNINGSGHEGIIAKMQAGAGGNDSLSLFVTTAGDVYGSVNGPTYQTVSGGIIPLNTWTHLAVTYNGSNVLVYRNGVLVHTSGTLTRPAASTGSFYIGGRGAQHPFNGRIDEVEVFNKVLTLAEVQAIHAADTGGKCKPSDLRVTKTHTGDFEQGGTHNYTVTVGNDGPAATSGVTTMTDTLPTGLTPTVATGTNWACNIVAPTVTCTSSAAIPAGGSFPPITLTVSVAANSPLSLTNTATVSGGGEMDTSDDSASDPTTVIPETEVVISGGNVTITDTLGGTSTDNITISCTTAPPPDTVVISDPANGLNQSIPLSSITGSITVNTLGGNDTLTLDLAGCNFTANGVNFNGGDPTTGPGDKLIILGGSTTTQTFNFTNEHDGSVVLAGARSGTINYTGLEPVSSTITAANVVLNYSTSTEIITVTQDGGDATLTKVDSNVGGETVSFVNPTTSLQINGGDTGNDTINVNGFGTSGGGLKASLTINGGTGNDLVSLNSSITFASGSNLDIDLENDAAAADIDLIDIGPGAIVALLGNGSATLSASQDVDFLAGSSLTTVDGAITVNANQQDPATPGSFTSVTVQVGSIVQSTGSGNVTINGRGGDNALGGNVGVVVTGGSKIIGGTSGLLAINGRGGASTGPTNTGVLLSGVGSTITSNGASIQVTGQGGGVGAAADSSGVFVDVSGSISATGASIQINGTAGGAANSRGVQLQGSSTVSNTGTGTISIAGIATNGNRAVRVVQGASVAAVNGNIAITADQSGTFVPGIEAFTLSNAVAVGANVTTTGAGSISVAADSMGISTTGVSMNAGANAVTLRQFTNTRPIDLGAADSGTLLGLTDAELDRITAGTVIVGDANSGAMSVTGVISPLNYKTLSLQKGVAFTSTGGFDSEVTSATVFEKMQAAGAVTIDPAAALTATAIGGFVPANGNSFTMVENTSMSATTGTFTGKPEGSSLTLGGVSAFITYIGGTGSNDVVIGVDTAGPKVTSTVPTAAAIGVPTNSNITINFNEKVNIGAGGITLNCGGVQTFAPVLPKNGVTSIVVDPTNLLPAGLVCTATGVAANIKDLAGNLLDGDGNNTGGDNFTLTFTTACTNPTVVTTNGDSGAGSLRDAVLNACPGSTITFQPGPLAEEGGGRPESPDVTSPIVLTSGEIAIDKSLIILGPGAGNLTVSGNNASRIFNIGSVTPAINVTISGLTIANGKVIGAPGGLLGGVATGGGISNSGTGVLNITGVVLSGNSVTGGSASGAAGIGGSGLGAALYNGESGVVNVTASTLSGNSAVGGAYSGGTGQSGSGFGGGIFNAKNGTVNVDRSTLSGNSVTGGNNTGTGISISGGGGGGAIYNYNGSGLGTGTVNVTNSTLSGNTAIGGGGLAFGGPAFGGAIFNSSNGGLVSLIGSTIFGNSVVGGAGGTSAGTGEGGGVYSGGGFAVTISKDSIIAGNTAGPGPDVRGPFTSQGYNLIGKSDGSTGFTQPSDQTGTAGSPLNPLLAPLANNGGPTQTHALCVAAGIPHASCTGLSPAIDKGGAVVPALTTDQRGETRPLDNPSIAPATGGNDSDIGAFEVQNTPPTINASGAVRRQGSGVSNSTIASVTDAESGNGGVAVTVNGGASATVNGVTVSNILNNGAGVITANIEAACGATNALFTLTATDGGGFTATAAFGVLVLPNTPPVLSYNSQTLTAGTTLSFNPATGPSDNGTVGAVTLQSVTPNTGLAVSVNPGSGQVNITAATVAGTYTVVITVTDNCGVTTTATFTVNVTCPTVTVGPASLLNGTLTAPYSQTITASPAGGNYTFAVTSGALPTGLNLNPTTGLLSGTPTANGTFSFQIAAMGFGSCPGSRNYTVTIAKADTATTVVSSQPTTTYGDPVTFTATVDPVTPATGVPTGTVNFFDNSNPIAACQGVGLTAGQAQCPTSALAAGNHTISAVYSGSGVYNASTGTTSQTVGKANATCTITPYNVTYDGLPHTATGQCTGVGGAGDVLAGLVLTGTTHTAAGSYPLDPWTFTDVTGNYNNTSGTVADNIGKAVLTVTADNKTRVYGAPNPAFTATFTGFVNGETLATSGVAGAPSLTTTATQFSPVSGSPYTITAALGGLTAANYSFVFVNGSLTITQAATTTVITNAAALAANPTTLGQGYAVNWTTSPVAPSTGVPTGFVTVSDGTDTCTAAVGDAACSLISTTFGVKNITATYGGDSNMTGSTSTATQPSVPHSVQIGITGNVKQFGTNANLAGVTITLSGSAAAVTVTDVNGNYAFSIPVTGGSYLLTPSGLSLTYEPITRSYTNVTTNITNADFTAYTILGAGMNPRNVRVQNTNTIAGNVVDVPVVVTSRGNEASFSFSLNYDTAVMGTPTVACGSNVTGCTLAVNTTQPGRVGIRIVPTAVLTAGMKEIAKVTFQTFANNLVSTPVSFGDTPLGRDIRNAEGNPLPALYHTGFVTFTQGSQGLEGDIVDANGTPAGGDGVKANDVTIISQMVLGNIPGPVLTPNQFQRADVNGNCGNGAIDAGDVTVTSQYSLGNLQPLAACGPTVPVIIPSRPETTDTVGRIIRAVSTNGVAGQTVTVPIIIESQGNEASISYTITFPQATLSNPQVALGSGVPGGTTFGLNTSQVATGKLGVLVATANTYAAGTRQMITVTFNIAAGATPGNYPVGFSSTPVGQSVSAAQGGAIFTDVTYEAGNVVLGATAAAVEVSGRVTTPDGRGLRNATVTMTDENGNRRTATTGTFGSYRFEDVEAGKTYVVTVASQRYRFASKVVNATDHLMDVDFVGLE